MQYEQMIERLEDEINTKDTGFVTFVTVVPGGTQNGLDYGPVGVEVVVLDADTVAYRGCSDSQDTEWQVGQAEDVIDLALQLEPDED